MKIFRYDSGLLTIRAGSVYFGLKNPTDFMRRLITLVERWFATSRLQQKDSARVGRSLKFFSQEKEVNFLCQKHDG